MNKYVFNKNLKSKRRCVSAPIDKQIFINHIYDFCGKYGLQSKSGDTFMSWILNKCGTYDGDDEQLKRLAGDLTYLDMEDGYENFGLIYDCDEYSIPKEERIEHAVYINSNGIPYISGFGGDDSSIGVVVVIFWDGRYFRVLYPVTGNTWSSKTMSALRCDLRYTADKYGNTYDTKELIQIEDIKSQFGTDFLRDHEDTEQSDFDYPVRWFNFEDIDYDFKLCQEDLDRILVTCSDNY